MLVRMTTFLLNVEPACVHDNQPPLFSPPTRASRAGVQRRFLRRPDDTTHFDGAAPTYSDADFVPLEVSSGSLVLLHGALVHRSEENRSPRSRHAFTLHVLEGAPGIEYPRTNWLQRPAPAVPLYDEPERAQECA